MVYGVKMGARKGIDYCAKEYCNGIATVWEGGMRDKPGKVPPAIQPQPLISKPYKLTTPRLVVVGGLS